MIQGKLGITSNEQLSETCWRMTLECPQPIPEIKPGQFVNIRFAECNYPLFRRPFSVFRSIKGNSGHSGIQIVYQVVGKGTTLMSRLRKGDELDVIGPLGHGFEQYRDTKVHVLLAGGAGSAGLFMLGEQIARVAKEFGLELYVLLGAETERHLVLENEFRRLNGKVLVSTENGRYGYRGSAVEMLKDAIDRREISSACGIYACGPEPMLKSLVPICQKYHIPAQVSIERHMMCGHGACLSCSCKVDKSSVLKHRDLKSSHIQFIPEEEFGYALVCKDGPVFHIDEVIFDE